MNTQIRERADRLHADALARYALALDERYQAAVKGCSRRYTQLLRWNALALLGSPHHQVNHLEMSEAQCGWMLYVIRVSDAELLKVISGNMKWLSKIACERNDKIVELRAEIKSLKAVIESQDEGRLPQNDNALQGKVLECLKNLHLLL